MNSNNTEFKAGMVAYLRTTDEPLFILEVKEGSPHQTYPDLSGQTVTVRRPIQGRDGVRHEVQFFTIEELETLAAKQNRQVLEMNELKARFAPDAPITDPSQLLMPN